MWMGRGNSKFRLFMPGREKLCRLGDDHNLTILARRAGLTGPKGLADGPKGLAEGPEGPGPKGFHFLASQLAGQHISLEKSSGNIFGAQIFPLRGHVGPSAPSAGLRPP